MLIRILTVITAALMLQTSPVQAEEFPLCQFPKFIMPDDALIYAAGNYRGRDSDWELDRGGGRAGIMQVAVNSPDRPVVLLLGAYNPTVWHIGWTEGTRILAVAASGYHTQAVSGLPPETLVLDSFSTQSRICPYFTDALDPKKSAELDQLSKLLTGRNPDGRFGQTSSGRILAGPPIAGSQPVLTARKLHQADFDLNWPLENFLLTAVRRQQIRPATAREYVEWVTARNATAGQAFENITVPANLTSEAPWNPVWAYLVLDNDFLPALTEALPKLNRGGRRITTFYLSSDTNWAQPLHGAKFLNLKDGTCLGETCGQKGPEVIRLK